jgi:hypothetical protein
LEGYILGRWIPFRSELVGPVGIAFWRLLGGHGASSVAVQPRKKVVFRMLTDGTIVNDTFKDNLYFTQVVSLTFSFRTIRLSTFFDSKPFLHFL